MCVRNPDNGHLLDDGGDPNGRDRSATRRHLSLARHHGHQERLPELPQGRRHLK